MRLRRAVFIFFLFILPFAGATARGALTDIRCWNDKRGFDSFSETWADWSPSGNGTLQNITDNSVIITTPVNGADEFDFRFKVFNNHCTPAKKYKYYDEEGAEKTTALPPWSIIAIDEEGSIFEFRISSCETDYDGISTSQALKVEVLLDNVAVGNRIFSGRETNIADRFNARITGPDYSGARNAFRLRYDGDQIILTGGLHSPELLMSIPVPEDFSCHSVGFMLYPATELELKEMSLKTSSAKTEAEKSLWLDFEELNSYLANSRDVMEGYWQILDRSLDEDLLKLGGDYRLAIVKASDGYDIIYLNGGTVNEAEWRFGMIKGHLSPSGIDDIWNLSWTDSMFNTLSHDITAFQEQAGTLSVQLPYHNSTFRLQKTATKKEIND